MPKLVEMFAAAILVVTMLAIIAIAMGFCPAARGRAGEGAANDHAGGHRFVPPSAQTRLGQPPVHLGVAPEAHLTAKSVRM